MISSVSKLADQRRFILNDVAFYGRTFDEYVEMFNLDPDKMPGMRILDCASGPASFSAEAKQLGIYAFACDPMYVHTSQDLIPRAADDIKLCIRKSGAHQALFETSANSINEKSSHYVAEKQRAIFTFSRDYTDGKAEGRYIAGRLPDLPFASNSFDLVLSAHLLFVYASRTNGGMLEDDRFSLGFHIESIMEMLRVSRNEVRIYPLKGPNSTGTPLLNAVLEFLRRANIETELIGVNYKDIVGADKMLRIKKKKEKLWSQLTYKTRLCLS